MEWKQCDKNRKDKNTMSIHQVQTLGFPNNIFYFQVIHLFKDRNFEDHHILLFDPSGYLRFQFAMQMTVGATTGIVFPEQVDK